jgi:putative serine/threonine protein kinase
LNYDNPPGKAQLIGKGRQGRVYRIGEAEERCVKLYRRPKYAAMEREAYRLARGSPHLPQIYDSGPSYLEMDYVAGPTMEQKLKNSGRLTQEDALLLISVYQEMERLRFTRLDIALFHILLPQKPGCWKMIDLVHAYSRSCGIPKAMLSGLRRLGLLEEFIRHLKALTPELYASWRLSEREVDKLEESPYLDGIAAAD